MREITEKLPHHISRLLMSSGDPNFNQGDVATKAI